MAMGIECVHIYLHATSFSRSAACILVQPSKIYENVKKTQLASETVTQCTRVCLCMRVVHDEDGQHAGFNYIYGS